MFKRVIKTPHYTLETDIEECRGKVGEFLDKHGVYEFDNPYAPPLPGIGTILVVGFWGTVLYTTINLIGG
jgi:hypothetical protein